MSTTPAATPSVEEEAAAEGVAHESDKPAEPAENSTGGSPNSDVTPSTASEDPAEPAAEGQQ